MVKMSWRDKLWKNQKLREILANVDKCNEAGFSCDKKKLAACFWESDGIEKEDFYKMLEELKSREKIRETGFSDLWVCQRTL